MGERYPGDPFRAIRPRRAVAQSARARESRHRSRRPHGPAVQRRERARTSRPMLANARAGQRARRRRWCSEIEELVANLSTPPTKSTARPPIFAGHERSAPIIKAEPRQHPAHQRESRERLGSAERLRHAKRARAVALHRIRDCRSSSDCCTRAARRCATSATCRARCKQNPARAAVRIQLSRRRGAAMRAAVAAVLALAVLTCCPGGLHRLVLQEPARPRRSTYLLSIKRRRAPGDRRDPRRSHGAHAAGAHRPRDRSDRRALSGSPARLLRRRALERSAR